MIETDELLSMEVIGSSCISGFTYFKDKKILRVEFTHGGTYDYGDIPESVVKRWMKSSSFGKFYNKEIKKYG